MGAASGISVLEKMKFQIAENKLKRVRGSGKAGSGNKLYSSYVHVHVRMHVWVTEVGSVVELSES